MAWSRAATGVASHARRRTLIARATAGTSSTRSAGLINTPLRRRASAPRVVEHFRLTDSLYDGTSSVHLEELLQHGAREADPLSYDESTDNFFLGQAAPSAGLSGQTIEESMHLLPLVRAFQVKGHMKARLAPLSLDDRAVPEDLDLSKYGFAESDLEREFFLGVWKMPGFLSENRPVLTLREILSKLEQAYCDTIGFEYMHIPDRDKCNWLREKIETASLSDYQKDSLLVRLDRLIWSTQFENFLATNRATAKRFGHEGAEMLITGMKEMFDRSADLGVENIVIGMPHRGSLNVIGNVVRKPLSQIFSESAGGTRQGEDELYTGTGDVKYHLVDLGTSNDCTTRGVKRFHYSLVASPSQEAVDPVVVGKTLSNDADRTKNMGILIHGDGSFAGQGIVQEALHLSALPNYTTGGTIHIVVNNQIAFKTDPRAGRSSQYCTDVAKAVNVRFGHNEIDEPSLTQLKMYKVIKNHPNSLKLCRVKPEVLKRVPNRSRLKAVYPGDRTLVNQCYSSDADRTKSIGMGMGAFKSKRMLPLGTPRRTFSTMRQEVPVISNLMCYDDYEIKKERWPRLAVCILKSGGILQPIRQTALMRPQDIISCGGVDIGDLSVYFLRQAAGIVTLNLMRGCNVSPLMKMENLLWSPERRCLMFKECHLVADNEGCPYRAIYDAYDDALELSTGYRLKNIPFELPWHLAHYLNYLLAASFTDKRLITNHSATRFPGERIAKKMMLNHVLRRKLPNDLSDPRMRLGRIVLEELGRIFPDELLTAEGLQPAIDHWARKATTQRGDFDMFPEALSPVMNPRAIAGFELYGVPRLIVLGQILVALMRDPFEHPYAPAHHFTGIGHYDLADIENLLNSFVPRYLPIADEFCLRMGLVKCLETDSFNKPAYEYWTNINWEGTGLLNNPRAVSRPRAE